MGFDLLSTLGADEVTAAIFTEDRAVAGWLAVEAAFTRALVDAGVLDAASGERIVTACTPANIDRNRLWAEAAMVGYPILPLVRMIVEALEPADGGWVHYGATTQDIMDTALSVQLRDAGRRLIELTVAIGDALVVLVERHAATVMAGRTHAQQAVPTTFGAKCAVFLSEFTRHVRRLRSAVAAVTVVSSFGAAGTSAALGDRAPAVRAALAREMGLRDTEVPWHVARDGLAEFAGVAAQLSGTCVRWAREIIDLSRTEVGEVAEVDGLYRGASSTMPQKANPISAETAIGFSVMAQAAAQAMLRAMESGHERAAGEWQIEWQAMPLVCQSTAGALRAVSDIVTCLRVFPDRMDANLRADGGRLMAEAYMIALATRVGRDRAHELLYQAVRRSRERNEPLQDALRGSVSDEVWTTIVDILPEPAQYVGQTPSICAAAVHEWSRLHAEDLEHHRTERTLAS